MTLHDIMRRHVVTASRDDIIDEVASELSDTHIGCVVVLDDGEPVGILTDRDISIGLDANWVDTSRMTVGELATKHLVTVDVDTGLLELSELMNEHGVRRLPVMDDGELVGIVSQDDLIVHLSKILNNLAGIVQTESPPELWGRAY